MTSTTEMPWRWLDPSRLASSPPMPADGRPEAQRPVIARETVGVCRVRLLAIAVPLATCQFQGSCHLPVALSSSTCQGSCHLPVPLACAPPHQQGSCHLSGFCCRVTPLLNWLCTADLVSYHGSYCNVWLHPEPPAAATPPQVPPPPVPPPQVPPFRSSSHCGLTLAVWLDPLQGVGSNAEQQEERQRQRARVGGQRTSS